MSKPFLDGLRVVEVAILAPNQLGMHLADLGADVIKIEMPGRGDYTHSVGGARFGGLSMLHLRWNRGKRSLVLDLRKDEGAAVFLDLGMMRVSRLRRGCVRGVDVGCVPVVAVIVERHRSLRSLEYPDGVLQSSDTPEGSSSR